MSDLSTKSFLLSVMLVAPFALAGCPGEQAGADAGIDAAVDDAGVIECKVVAPTECADPPPVYADVAPIIEQRCLGCHYGMEDGPWPLNTFNHVADWNVEIRGVMIDCSMPPADSGMPPMTNEEREEILMWIRCGFPQD